MQHSIISINCRQVNILFKTSSTDLPLPAIQPTGAWVDAIPDGPNQGGNNLGIAKFSSDGKQLIYATYFGPDDKYNAFDIEINSKDEYYVLAKGAIGNYTFPKAGAYSSSWGHLFIQKWSPGHKILWATPFKSSLYSKFGGMCIDANDNVFLTGESTITDLVNPGAGAYFKSTTQSYLVGFISKLDSADSLVWSTYVGKQFSDIATDGDHVFIVGTNPRAGFNYIKPGPKAYFDSIIGYNSTFLSGDAFIVEFNNSGQMLWSTLIGGNADDKAVSVAADNDGNVFVFGETVTPTNEHFPLIWNHLVFNINEGPMGYLDGGFISSFNSDRMLTWSTFFGAEHYDFSSKIRTFQNKYLYISGNTNSGNTIFPLQDLGGTSWYDATKPYGAKGQKTTYAARFDISQYSTFVSIEEIETTNDWELSVYPNPTNNILNFNLEEDVQYELIDITGKLIKKGELGFENATLNVQFLSTGSYILKLHTQTKQATVKFIKE